MALHIHDYSRVEDNGPDADFSFAVIWTRNKGIHPKTGLHFFEIFFSSNFHALIK